MARSVTTQTAGNPDTPVQYLKGVGPARAELLARQGIRTISDLLYAFPRKHYDRSRLIPIREVRPGELQTIQGEIRATRLRRAGRMVMVEADIDDGTGEITAVWFNQPFLKNYLRPGDQVILSGKIDFFRTLQIKHPEYEVVPEDSYEPLHARGIVPAYTVPRGLSPRSYRVWVRSALQIFAGGVPEIFPQSFLKKRDLTPTSSALWRMHFPKTQSELRDARARFVYEEFMLMQVLLALRRMNRRHEKASHPLRVSQTLDRRIRMFFPFELTPAQERAIEDIRRDLENPYPMSRLLQGDVGSGKTMVALYALLCAVGNRTQAAFMAPTEILAAQHHRTLTTLLPGDRIRIAFLGRGQKRAERNAILSALAAGTIDLAIGTHAMIQDQVAFKNLAMVAIDEQHKFGVEQRSAMQAKGRSPHVLFMTATPIPRTLMMTTFGDLDVSIIDQMPPGRRPVKTIHKPSSQISESMEFIAVKLREGCQVYFVYPLIDESDALPLKSAVQMHETIRRRFPHIRCALIHGELARSEKDSIMSDFRKGVIKILISTLVIEVGIDVPNATLMVVEHAERYGLAQLHQLRGRIARGAREGYFLLFADPVTDQARERLKTLVETQDGFKIAEKDLAIRGPGELLGLQQSGWPEFDLADPLADVALLNQARNDAASIVRSDPRLTLESHRPLREALRKKYPRLARWIRSG